MAKNNLMIELGFEELPVGAMTSLRESAGNFLKEFPCDFRDNDFIAKVYLTPRRHVFFIENIKLMSNETFEDVKGPPEKLVFSNDDLTKAGEGFLKSKNISVEDIVRRDGFVYYKKKTGGEELASVFPELFKKWLLSVSFEKTMKWNSSGHLFPRPIRWATGFINNNPLLSEIAGVKFESFTFGNRTISNSRIPVFNGYDYLEKMKENYVELDFEERKNMILNETEKTISKMSLSLVHDEELLNEVADLVEYPVIFCGAFDERFLNLPEAIIMAALKQHQRYFSLKNSKKELSPHFVFVSNSPYAESEDIVRNNQRIISSRLEDAEFYYKNDLSRDLSYYENALKNTVFHEKLGTYYDKTKRNADLVSWLIGKLNLNVKADLKLVSVISKMDAASDMIKDGKEFTKLQGTIGSHYAEKMGYPKETADVSREHYLPLTNEGEMPESLLGTLFSVSEKADNIAGAFVLGSKPTGSKDPMSVRRDSLSLIYLLMKKNLTLDVSEIIEKALLKFERTDLKGEIEDYMKKRTEILLTSYGIPYDAARCALSGGGFILTDIANKGIILNKARSNDDFRDVVIGMKRVSNILKEEKKEQINTEYENEYERNLFEMGKQIDEENKILLDSKQFDKVLSNLLRLRKPIDEFFDNVMVMEKNQDIKKRRVQLLFFIRSVFLEFGDFSQIVFDSSAQEGSE